MEELLISPYLKRRIKRRAIRDYQTSEYQNSLFLFNVAPCAHPEIDVEGNDYKGNVHKKRAISSPAFFIAVVIRNG